MPGAGGMCRDVLGAGVAVELLGDTAGTVCDEELRVDDDADCWRSWVAAALLAALLVLCVA